jgi:hypothetical protein
MHGTTECQQQKNNSRLESIAMAIRAEAQSGQGNVLALLALLRLLEGLHQDIRDNFFMESLPNDRQALYTLLKNIEDEGGWPFIQRMKLRSLLANLPNNTLYELEPDERQHLPSSVKVPNLNLVSSKEKSHDV